MKSEIEEDVMELNGLDFVPFDEWEYAPTPSSENEEVFNSFRLGLELETGKLFSDDILNWHRFHKEPLFTCTKDGRKLFHFEIDGSDVEFVTSPFSTKDESDLRDCISMIQKASAILKEQVNSETNFTLKKWYDQLESIGLNLHKESLFEKLENQVISWKKGTQKWEGFFQPHATIQLPLEKVIEIVFEIFESVPTIISIFEASLPFKSKDDFMNFIKSDTKTRKILLKKFNTKIDGLMFLMAETLLNLTIPVFGNKSEIELNENLMQDEIKFHQSCPKIFLHIMSRRPFSDMHHQLEDESQKVGFSNLFKMRMRNNLLFTNLDSFLKYYNTGIFDEKIEFNGVPQNFEKINYAAYFF